MVYNRVKGNNGKKNRLLDVFMHHANAGFARNFHGFMVRILALDK